MASAQETATLPFSFETFTHLSAPQKMGAIAALAFAIALVAGAWMWSRNVEYSILFSNISERDGGQIIVSLQQMNVPYKFSEGGGAIMVPASQVHDARLKLASQGLPKGGLVGFEVMETQKLGASQFLEQINYQRALEGELARSIQSLQAVHAARVHLAIPKSSAFLRDEQKPTASVVLSLYPGRVLEPGQVAGIVHLVSSSVAQLSPTSVSVIDQDGNLISQAADPSRDAGLDPTQLKYLRDLELGTIHRIEAIIEPLVGSGNVRAQAAADVDFTQTDQMAESYKPNPAQETAIRSQQTAETGGGAPAGATGIPGALSNQPPVPATAPLTAPGVSGTTSAANAATSSSISRNATTNYELDKTIKHTKGGMGTIKRLSVAVVVNHKKSAPDKDGKVKSTPLTPAEMQQINDLVREAMGFNKDRGDTLNVANVSFNAGEKEAIVETPIWKSPEVLAMARESVKYLVAALVAFFLWNKMLKPLFNTWMKAAEARRKHELALEQAQNTAQGFSIPQREYDTKLAGARELAKQDPKMVANVIKEWVSGNEQ